MPRPATQLNTPLPRLKGTKQSHHYFVVVVNNDPESIAGEANQRACDGYGLIGISANPLERADAQGSVTLVFSRRLKARKARKVEDKPAPAPEPEQEPVTLPTTPRPLVAQP